MERRRFAKGDRRPRFRKPSTRTQRPRAVPFRGPGTGFLSRLHSSRAPSPVFLCGELSAAASSRAAEPAVFDPCVHRLLRHLHHFIAGPGCQRGHQIVGVVADQPHASIGKCKYRSAPMMAPEVKCVAWTFGAPGLKEIRTNWTGFKTICRFGWNRRPHFSHTEIGSNGPCSVLPGSGIPPAKKMIRSLRPLAHQKRV